MCPNIKLCVIFWRGGNIKKREEGQPQSCDFVKRYIAPFSNNSKEKEKEKENQFSIVWLIIIDDWQFVNIFVFFMSLDQSITNHQTITQDNCENIKPNHNFSIL